MLISEPDYEIAHRNAAMFYQSEQTQGKHVAMVGAVVIVVGWAMSKVWLIAVGIVVVAAGYSRMNRAGDTYNAANLVYASALGTKV